MARTKHLKKADQERLAIGLSIFPNFSASGSIRGMKKRYYGNDAFLVRCGQYVYKVTEEIYNLVP